MPAHFSARFMRVGEHLINVEAIQQVTLKKDRSAVLTLNGPRKSLQQIRVPQPWGSELWSFVHQNLVVVDFGEPVDGEKQPPPAKDDRPQKKGKKAKDQRRKGAAAETTDNR